MKRLIRKSFLIFTSLFFMQIGMQAHSQPTEAEFVNWPTGAIFAVNVKERKLVIDKQVYRVALKASLSYADGSKMSFSELEPKYVISYQLEPDTGDIVDIVAVAIP